MIIKNIFPFFYNHRTFLCIDASFLLFEKSRKEEAAG